MRLLRSLILVLAVVPAFVRQAPAVEPEKIGHIFLIYMENRSFDQMLHGFPGADTLPGPKIFRQADTNGDEYEKLDMPEVKGVKLPGSVENAPFDIDKIYPRGETLPNPIHRFFQNQFQINGGRNDLFYLYAGVHAKGLVMGYHSNEKTALWRLALEYTLCDRFFQGAFGGSFLNHQWLVSAATPVFKDAPDRITAGENKERKHFRDGLVTKDGYAVNTLFPQWPGQFESNDPPLLPPQTGATIADRLDAKGISWKWYSQGWNMALKDLTASRHEWKTYFTPHHIPLIYYQNCMMGTACFKDKHADREDMLRDIGNGKLPKVTFYKPGDALDQHPGTGKVDDGDNEIDTIVSAIMKSPLWNDTVIIITYDENGGFWDHVAPPSADRWGPGSRVPAVIVSPLAKKGFVDHTTYDTTSILKFIEKRFGLQPLGGERFGDLFNTLE